MFKTTAFFNLKAFIWLLVSVIAISSFDSQLQAQEFSHMQEPIYIVDVRERALVLRFREMKLGDEERVRGFCREVWSETVRLTCKVILDTAFGKSFGEHELVDAVSSGRGQLGLARVSLSPRMARLERRM